ncbi:SPFH domain-containing protein [Mucilaginibacter myungsuensis]|uniref:SPFH domain-containing protein n=1 Tax=Mucilaginibacter myungsuensis TaxID=649104 RepID=A0A929KZZ1_9SPHI|nr:SPFH domain-containing protein [Mucilaginibacter myungsuensis]MBE9664302.1 SPFH domain-containing protein [Mucilaginibacter myungsuensis]MDN3597011.1 SPFH domain-containing protein [Mucilaginibacter myungsuensis]
MSFFNKLLGEFIDVIEWVDNTQNTLVWKFPRNDNAIKMGAKLTVRESQAAIFVNEGKIADVFMPGMYELQTSNMPILTTLNSWKHLFNSPFKVDIYFVSLRQFTNQKWGTKNPVMIRDAEFGPVRLRAFGSFNFRVFDPKMFFTEVSATNPNFNVEDISEQLRNTVVSRSMDAVAQSKLPVLDLAANYDELGALITKAVQPDMTEIGLNVTKLLVENISLPAEVEQVLDKRSSMGIIGNLGAYAQFQAANAMEQNATSGNSIGGTMASAGIGLATGAAMMGQMGNVFQQNQFDPNQGRNETPPPPPPAPVEFHVAVDGKSVGPRSLSEIDAMISNEAITRDTLVWKKGMAGWAAASTVAELADLFSNEPPPLA